jgi:hypothetical protein
MSKQPCTFKSVKTDHFVFVLCPEAVCHGSGSDKYKWVSGGDVRRVFRAYPGAVVVVPSNTNYNGRAWKQAVLTSSRCYHRQLTTEQWVELESCLRQLDNIQF